jgi:hypothetical protein
MIARTLHLTKDFSDVLAHQIRATHPGQAHVVPAHAAACRYFERKEEQQ